MRDFDFFKRKGLIYYNKNREERPTHDHGYPVLDQREEFDATPQRHMAAFNENFPRFSGQRNGDEYYVKDFDTFETIAQKTGLDAQRILQNNSTRAGFETPRGAAITTKMYLAPGTVIYLGVDHKHEIPGVKCPRCGVLFKDNKGWLRHNSGDGCVHKNTPAADIPRMFLREDGEWELYYSLEE